MSRKERQSHTGSHKYVQKDVASVSCCLITLQEERAIESNSKINTMNMKHVKWCWTKTTLSSHLSIVCVGSAHTGAVWLCSHAEQVFSCTAVSLFNWKKAFQSLLHFHSPFTDREFIASYKFWAKLCYIFYALSFLMCKDLLAYRTQLEILFASGTGRVWMFSTLVSPFTFF